MENLDTLRTQIDEIDKKMMALFEKRMDVSRRVGEYKIANNIPVLNSAREKTVIENTTWIIRGILSTTGVTYNHSSFYSLQFISSFN